MKKRTSLIWAVILALAQFVVVAYPIATRMTPLARQFTGWSAYAAMATMLAIPFLLIAGPFFWRSHRRLAVSGFCIAVGAVTVIVFSSW